MIQKVHKALIQKKGHACLFAPLQDLKRPDSHHLPGWVIGITQDQIHLRCDRLQDLNFCHQKILLFPQCIFMDLPSTDRKADRSYSRKGKGREAACFGFLAKARQKQLRRTVSTEHLLLFHLPRTADFPDQRLALNIRMGDLSQLLLKSRKHLFFYCSPKIRHPGVAVNISSVNLFFLHRNLLSTTSCHSNISSVSSFKGITVHRKIRHPRVAVNISSVNLFFLHRNLLSSQPKQAAFDSHKDCQGQDTGAVKQPVGPSDIFELNGPFRIPDGRLFIKFPKIPGISRKLHSQGACHDRLRLRRIGTFVVLPVPAVDPECPWPIHPQKEGGCDHQNRRKPGGKKVRRRSPCRTAERSRRQRYSRPPSPPQPLSPLLPIILPYLFPRSWTPLFARLSVPLPLAPGRPGHFPP